MSRARTLANLGGVTSSATELNLLDGQTDLASQAELDAATFDDDKMQTNLALLAFRTAVNGSGLKFNLQDQVIDEYGNPDGVDGTPSINQVLASGVYSSTFTGITHDADYTGVIDGNTWYKWTGTGTGTFSTSSSASWDFLVIAGGGGGGGVNQNESGAGGGGAGGYRNSYASEATGGGGLNEAALSLVASTSYTITVGAGGAGRIASNGVGTSGGPSSIVGLDITDITTVGGGGGAGSSLAGAAGGSGGGQGYNGSGGGRTLNQGFVGAGGYFVGSLYAGSGGGGAGGPGGVNANSSTGGVGGIGLSSSIDGTATDRGGGGGASGSLNGGGTPGTASHGGGAGSDPGTGVAGTDGKGGGGGGGGPEAGVPAAGGDGGDGIVIIRGTTIASIYTNLTLQSTDTVAEAEPDYADMVMLVEDAGNLVGTENTHIKGWVSRDSGTTFTQGTLVDEGDWGTDKRILAFHDLDISGQPTGGSGDTTKSMCYKITTHSASADYDTKIHATSIGWR